MAKALVLVAALAATAVSSAAQAQVIQSQTSQPVLSAPVPIQIINAGPEHRIAPNAPIKKLVQEQTRGNNTTQGGEMPDEFGSLSPSAGSPAITDGKGSSIDYTNDMINGMGL